MATNESDLDIVIRTRDETTASLKKVESSIIRFVGAVSSLLSVFGTVVFPIKEAAEFQKEMINVAKTTDFTDVQIRQLSRGLQQLSTTVDLTATELAKIAAIAGQLGLGSAGVQGIQQFTETTARFSSVINVSVEEAANGLAKLLNIFKINVKEVERISSLLNELSNNSTASGAELIDIIQRIGTAGGKLNIQQAAALAALGRDLGLTMETVGTSFQKVFLDLQTKAAKIAPLVGKSLSEFVSLDGVTQLRLYLTLLKQLPAEVRATFSEETTGGGRIFGLTQNLVNDAINGFTLLDSRMKIAAEGFTSGTSAIREQERVMQGFSKQLALVRNNFLNLAISIGEEALPFLTQLAKQLQEGLRSPQFVEGVKQLAREFGSWAKAGIDLIQALVRLSDNLGPLVRLAQIFVGLKLANYFVDVSASLLGMVKNAETATRAFLALAAGRAAVTKQFDDARKKEVLRAGGVELSPLAAGVGSLVGKPQREAMQAAAAAEAANTARIKEQTALMATVNDALIRRKALQAEIQAGLAAESVLEQRLAAVRAGATLQQGETLRSLNAQLAAQRLAIEANRASYVQLVREGGAAIAAQRASLAAANAAAAESAAAAAGGLPRIIGRGLGQGLAGAAGILAALGKRIIGLVLPVAGWAITITSILSLFFGGFDEMIDFFARLVGFSSTARQKAQLDAKLREQAAARERDEVAALAAEYNKLQDALSVRSANSNLKGAIASGEVSQFLEKTQKDLTLIQAKQKQVNADIIQNAQNQARVVDETAKVRAQYDEQVIIVAKLRGELQNLLKAGNETGKLSVDAEGRLKTTAADLESAQRRLVSITKQLNDLQSAGIGLVREQANLRAQIPALISQEADRLKTLNTFFDSSAAKIAENELASAVGQAEKLVQIRAELQRLKDTGKDKDAEGKASAAFIALQQAEVTTTAALETLKQNLDNALGSASSLAREFIKLVVPDINKARLADLTSTLQKLKAAGGGKDTPETQAFSEQFAQAQAREIVLLAVRRRAFQDLAKAQQQFSDQAKRQAEDYKSAYERAANEAASAVREAGNRVALLQEGTKQRAQGIVLANFDATEARLQRITQRIGDLQQKAFRKQLEDQGRTPEEIERIMQIFQDNQEALEEQRRQSAQIQRVQVEYRLQVESTVRAQQDLTAEQSKQIDLQRQLKRATEAGDVNQIRELQAQLEGSRSRAEALIKTLEGARDKIAELSKTVIQGGVFTQPVSPIDPTKAEEDFKKTDAVITDAKNRMVATLDSLRAAGDASFTDINAKLKSTTDEMVKIEQRINEIVKQTPQIAGQFGAIAEAAEKSIPAMKALADTIERIRQGRFDQALTLPDATKLATDLATARSAMAGFADDFVVKLGPLLKGDTSQSNIVQQIMNAFSLKIDPQSMQRAVVDATRGTSAQIPQVQFPNARESLQAELDKAPFNVNINPQTGGGGNVPGRAQGGLISGPGTGTSDSILARLSNGEFVNDARTVRFFGPAFFAGLKSISRMGSAGIASMLAHGLPIPAFAGGGFVGNAGVGGRGTASTRVIDVVKVDLNVGGTPIVAFTERDQAKQLVRTLKKLKGGA